MKRKVLVLATAITLAASGSAFAGPGITEGPGKGNPETNPTGKCPPGPNQETSPGGLKKCP